MTGLIAEFRSKFRLEELLIECSETWTWSLRPAQITLGASVLSLNRFATSLAQMTPEEALGLRVMVKAIEKGLNTAFKFDKINYLMLMMVDDHTHFHVLPRYSKTIDFMGKSWSDPNWPKSPIMQNAPTEDRFLHGICEHVHSPIARP